MTSTMGESMIHSSRSRQCVPMSISAPPWLTATSCRQAPGIGGYQQVSCARPITIFAQRAALHQFAHLPVVDVLAHAPGEHELHAGFRAHAASIWSTSCVVIAIGFSQRTCLPACAACTVWRQCTFCGVAM